MLRREATDKPNEPQRDEHTHPTRPHRLKVSNLTPYLAEIERRKKQRSHLQRSKKLIHESSSKSFRIKEKSVTSLQKELLNRVCEVVAKKNPVLAPTHPLEIHPQKKRRTQSVNRHHELQFSKTIEHKTAQELPVANNFFNDLYMKIKNKIETSKETIVHKDIVHKETHGLRKAQYQTLEQQQRARSEQAGDLNMYKISFTKLSQPPTNSDRQAEIETQKHTEPPKKKNFRRNKYEAASQQIQKKDNNTAINLQMDCLAARQNQAFTQTRNRQFHGSIQKSTEKYFNYQSYRPIRSKNDIQIYLSTLVNPSLHKASHSTNEKSDNHNRLQLISSLQPPSNEYLQYDFDFKTEEQHPKPIVQDPQEQIVLMKQQTEFQKQRRKVQLQFFNKAEPHLDWSEDQCKVDDI